MVNHGLNSFSRMIDRYTTGLRTKELEKWVLIFIVLDLVFKRLYFFKSNVDIPVIKAVSDN